jgi:anti-anti-sigma regulatory factor
LKGSDRGSGPSLGQRKLNFWIRVATGSQGLAAHPPLRNDPVPAAGLRALAYAVGDTAVIVVEGRLDGPGMRALDRAFADALDRGHRDVVLDLHGLRALDPDALSVLWAGLRATCRRGGTLSAAGLRPALRADLDPLTPHGLRLHRTVRAAISTPLGSESPA